MTVRPNWPLFAALVWGGGLVGVAVDAGLKPRAHTVFPIYAVAARGWVDGRPDLYLHQSETTEVYRYSPAFAVVTVPFAVLPPGWGNALWKLANGAVFLVGLMAWVRHALPWHPTPNQRAAIYLIAAGLAAPSLHVGQANLLMTGLVLLGLAAAARDRWWWAAFALAGATLVKVYPVALAAVLGVVFWRRFPARFAVALGIGLAAPFLAQRPEYVADRYAEWVGHLRGSPEINRDRLRSLDKLFELAGHPLSQDTVKLLAAAAGGVVLLVALVPGDRRDRLVRTFAWFTAWVLLYSPATENATYGILGPPLAEALVRHRGWGPRLVLGLEFLLTGPAITDLSGRFGNILGDRYGGPALGAVLFQFWLVAELIRRLRLAMTNAPPMPHQ